MELFGSVWSGKKFVFLLCAISVKLGRKFSNDGDFITVLVIEKVRVVLSTISLNGEPNICCCFLKTN